MTIEEISPDNTAVHISTTFPTLVPQQLFNYFTQEDLIIKWWPQTAVIHLREGGHFVLGWPAMNWTLRGVYTAVQPPKTLQFTWNWDHHPELDTRTVAVHITPHGTGSQLTLIHSQYTNSELDQNDRQDHIDGWLHFLNALQTIVKR